MVTCDTAAHAATLASAAIGDGATATADGNVVTVILETACQSVTFTGLASQVRIASISVETEA